MITYEAGWARFVDSLEEAWARFFDEGKQCFSAFQPWAGRIDKTRRNDPLLRYLIEARHQSQHGRFALEWSKETLSFESPNNAPYYLRGVKIWGDNSYEIEAGNTDGSEADISLNHVPSKPSLPRIFNRKTNEQFPPPTEHLSTPCFGSTPIQVAEMAFAFYQDVLRDAFSKFSPSEAGGPADPPE